MNTRQFEAEQKIKRMNIVQKILREEENVQRKKKLQPYLFADPQQEKALRVAPLKKKLPKILLDYIACSAGEAAVAEKVDDEKKMIQEKPSSDSFLASDEYHKLLRGLANLDEMGGEDEEIAENDEEAEGEELPPKKDLHDTEDEDDEEIQNNLAVPEFEGLWSKDTKSYKQEKEKFISEKPVKGSKMEKEILKKTLQKTREGIIITQMAAGREFSGRPFYSKPSVIHFKDFVVGKTYKKKVVLINVSYTLNFVKFVDITEALKDFITIDFKPHGQMSAGMKCDFMVTFKPLINVDMKGEVCFLAQTGPFQIPLVCSTKKCDLALDTNTIEFGTSVIGETLKRSFVLTNRGALGTEFRFFKVTGEASKIPVAEQEADSSGLVESNVEQSLTKPDLTPSKKDLSFEGLDKIMESVEKTIIDEENHKSTEDEMLVEGSVEKIEKELEIGTEKAIASPDLILEEEVVDVSALDGLKVGSCFAGKIAPFSSVTLEIIWQPVIPGQVNTEFTVAFADPELKPLSVQVTGNAIDAPVWIEMQTVDLKICMFDRLYQDTININNRASTSHKLQFETVKELQNHLELLPKIGYVQAHSQFSVQLKFLPRQSLFEDAADFFDPETGVLEAPISVRVSDQKIPVSFTVQAVVTTSDLEFGACNIDFGHCTIHESVKQKITLSNKSILPQQFGFVKLPDCLEVQPNDGFGTLLPLETLEVDVIFSPKAAKVYEMNLLCKTLINRDFIIPCRGVGVLTPLELSKQVIHFSATPLYDTSICALHVINSHTSTNECTHPVPRIGKEDVFPVGPTSFEFRVPKDVPITISPSVGTVLPGQKVQVEVRFSPTLNEDDIRLEALRIQTRLEEERKEKERVEAAQRLEQEMASGGKRKKMLSSKASLDKIKSRLTAPQSSSSSSHEDMPARFGSISANQTLYKAQESLIQQFEGQLQSITVPCYIAFGQAGNPGELNYSIHNTLYLDVHCPSVKPPLVVISDYGRRTVDFGNFTVGQTCSKFVTVQNISDKRIELKSTSLDPEGPFNMRNALRPLLPGAAHKILLTFTPKLGQMFQEDLGIKTLNSTLHLTLKGRGVKPLVNLSVENGVLDMRAVLVGECVEKPFTIENMCPLPIDFVITQDSISPLRHTRAQNIPPFLEKLDSDEIKNYVGPQNKSGRSVFDFVPATGTINTGESKEIMMTFAPDHESDLFSDGIRIELYSQESHFFQVIGQAKSQAMYLEGCDPLMSPMESLAFTPKYLDEESTATCVISQPVLITVHSVMKRDFFEPGLRQIMVGRVWAMANTQKKSGEFTIDGLQPLIQKGFTVHPAKGSIEADTKKTIEFTWQPPRDFDPNTVIEETVTVNLKCDIIEQIPLVIRALVVSE